MTVDVKNRGTAVLRLDNVRVLGTSPGVVAIVRESVPEEIPAGSHRKLVLEVASEAGVPTGTRLVVESSDPNHPRVVVPIIMAG